MKKLLLLLLTTLFASGCATTAIPPVSGESLQPIKTERVAVKYTLLAKQINYVETIYRVLWLETNTSSQDFSGIWSPDQDLTGYVVSRLRQQGIRAESVYDLVNPSLLVRGGTDVNDAGFSALSEALRIGGIRYLFELTAMNIEGNAIGYGMVTVQSTPNARMIDLRTNKVVWTTKLFHSEVYQFGGDLKKLEENSMSKTKEGLRAGINKIDFLSLWGIK